MANLHTTHAAQPSPLVGPGVLLGPPRGRHEGRRGMKDGLLRRLSFEMAPADLHKVALGSVVFLALLLRVTLLSAKSIWFDEAYSLFAAMMAPRDLITFITQTDAHPPGYYLLLHYWIRLVGTSEAALRLLSVVPSLGTVVVTYLLAHRMAGPRVGLLAGLLIAVAPVQIMAAQEARMYPLLGFLAIASTYLLWRAVEEAEVPRRGWRFWGGYALVTAVAVYVHYFAFLVLLAHGVYLSVFHFRRWRIWGWFALAVAVVSLLYVPWWQELVIHLTTGRAWAWFKTRIAPLHLAVDTTSLLAYGGYLFGGPSYHMGQRLPVKFLLPLVMPFLVLIAAGTAALAPRRKGGMLVAVTLLAPIGAVTVASVWLTFAYPRYFSFLSPPFAILAAAGIAAAARALQAVRARVVIAGLLLLVGTYIGPVLYDFYVLPDFEPYNWRGAAQHLAREARPDDVIAIYPGTTQPALSYYYRGTPRQYAVNIPDPRRPLSEHRPGPGQTSFTRTRVAQLWREHKRLWIVLTVPVPAGSREKLIEAVERYFEAEDMRVFGQFLWVTRYEPRRVPRPEPRPAPGKGG